MTTRRRRQINSLDPVLDNLLQELRADNLHPRLADLRSYLPGIKDKLLLETTRAMLIDRLTTIGIAAPARLVDAVFNGHSPDQTPEPQSGMGSQGGQAKRLVSLLEHETLFCAPDGESAFAVVNTNGHREVWSIRSKGFRSWLSYQFYGREQKPPSSQGIADALGMLEARARFSGKSSPISVRLASHGADIYLDLANAKWQAVKVTSQGWETIADPPVYFRRPRGSLALPLPEHGGSIDELREFVNIAPAEWPLFIEWLVAALRPQGPYPVLVLTGDHGAAKSTVAKVARRLIDPNSAELRAEPSNLQDLAIFAHNSWIIALDNLSIMPQWLSDGICRLATGAGFSTRELYSDTEETIVAFQRPVIVNAIEEIVTRPDLLDRAIVLYLPSIDDSQRRPEMEFWAAFEAARPRILGALLDALAVAIANMPKIKLAELPRMADFAVWAIAAEPALSLEPGAFMTAYTRRTAMAHQLALEASVIAEPIAAVIEVGGWEGTATELHGDLTARVGEAISRTKEWPKSPKALANALRRIAANLRAAGIKVTFYPPAGREKKRLISLEKAGDQRSAQAAKPAAEPISGLDADHADHADGRSPSPSELRTPGQYRCSSCGEDDFWKSRAGLLLCRRCHPPAPGAEAESANN